MTTTHADCTTEATPEQHRKMWSDHMDVINILNDTLDALLVPPLRDGGLPIGHPRVISGLSVEDIIKEHHKCAHRHAEQGNLEGYEEFANSITAMKFRNGWMTVRDYWQRYISNNG